MVKTLKIVGLDGMKCQWVAEQDFLLKFSGQLIDTLFLCFVSFSPTCVTELCSGYVLGYGLTDFFSRNKLDVKAVYNR